VLPSESVQIDLLRRSARLLAKTGAQLGKRPMVLPNSEFFPDRFTADPPSTQRLLERMQEQAGLLDIPIDVKLVAAPADDLASAHGCAGSCATPNVAAPNQRVIPQQDGWTLQLSPGELHHPVALTCTLARSLASIFLIENAARPEEIEAPFETSVDLAATALGFGVLLLEGSHIYSKSCGGPSIAQVTALNVGEHATLFAIFAHLHGHKPKRAIAELSTTQAAAVSEALRWAAVQKPLLDRLRQSPEQLLVEPLELHRERSLLSRLFPARQKAANTLEQALNGELPVTQRISKERPIKVPDPARDELRALVNDAFDSAK